MIKKYISVFLVIMAFVVVMTACNKDDNYETSTTNPTTEESQTIINEGITEVSSENTSDETDKPGVTKPNATKPSSSPSSTKPVENTTRPNATKPNVTKPNVTNPTNPAPTRPTESTTNKNEPAKCSICGGIIISNNSGGPTSIGKYCDGKCDGWFGD